MFRVQERNNITNHLQQSCRWGQTDLITVLQKQANATTVNQKASCFQKNTNNKALHLKTHGKLTVIHLLTSGFKLH